MSEAASAIEAGGSTPALSPTPSATPDPSSTPAPTAADDPNAAPPPSPAPATSEPTWRDKFLPEDLRGSESLANFKDVPDLAKGFIETKRMLGNRVAIPAADNPEAFTEFAQKVRPEKPEDYKLTVPEGQPSDTADTFRPIFHEAGLLPKQAEMLTDAWNQMQSDIVSKKSQAGRDEIHALEMDLGPQAYNQRVAATDNMLREAGIEIEAIVPALEQVSGAGKALQGLFALAEKTGELAKVDGGQVAMQIGKMTPQQASDEVDKMDANSEIRAKVADKTSPEYRRRQQYMEIMNKKA